MYTKITVIKKIYTYADINGAPCDEVISSV